MSDCLQSSITKKVRVSQIGFCYREAGLARLFYRRQQDRLGYISSGDPGPDDGAARVVFFADDGTPDHNNWDWFRVEHIHPA